MNSSQKKTKVTKINAKHVALKVEKPALEKPVLEKTVLEKTAPEKTASQQPALEQSAVAALAYQFWLEEGEHGDDLTRWLRAERQIKNAQS